MILPCPDSQSAHMGTGRSAMGGTRRSLSTVRRPRWAASMQSTESAN
jgi:hypothetical protein